MKCSKIRQTHHCLINSHLHGSSPPRRVTSIVPPRQQRPFPIRHPAPQHRRPDETQVSPAASAPQLQAPNPVIAVWIYFYGVINFEDFVLHLFQLWQRQRLARQRQRWNFGYMFWNAVWRIARLLSVCDRVWQFCGGSNCGSVVVKCRKQKHRRHWDRRKKKLFGKTGPFRHHHHHCTGICKGRWGENRYLETMNDLPSMSSIF